MITPLARAKELLLYNGILAPGYRLVGKSQLVTECEFFKLLDRKFNEDKRSPLHHDNRCDCMK